MKCSQKTNKFKLKNQMLKKLRGTFLRVWEVAHAIVSNPLSVTKATKARSWSVQMPKIQKHRRKVRKRRKNLTINLLQQHLRPLQPRPKVKKLKIKGKRKRKLQLKNSIKLQQQKLTFLPSQSSTLQDPELLEKFFQLSITSLENTMP